MRIVQIVTLLVMMLAPLSLQAAPAEAANCQFILGFKAIHDMIPDIVGDCKTDEYHNARNGDGLQETVAWHGKGGLLVWRKADNWTAFTDGASTWVNGPQGLQKRGNCERFAWENDPVGDECRGGPDIGWAVHNDAEKTFKYPVGWRIQQTTDGKYYRYLSQDGRAAIYFQAPFKMGAGFKVEEFLIKWVHDNPNTEKSGLTFLALERKTVNGFPAAVQHYQTSRQRGFVAAIQNGANIYMIEYTSLTPVWPTWERIFGMSLDSFIPKSAG